MTTLSKEIMYNSCFEISNITTFKREIKEVVYIYFYFRIVNRYVNCVEK